MKMVKTVLPLLLVTILFIGCESTPDNLTDGYSNLVSTMPPDQAQGAQNIFRGGRDIDMERANEVGNVCYDCNTAEEAVARPSNVAPISGDACRHYNRFRRAGVPEEPLKQALLFYQNNQSTFRGQRYISIADYSRPSTERRFYILDMSNGSVRREKVSHGSGNRNGVKVGDPNHDGMIDRCHHGSNINDRTNMTRAGFFQTRNFYRSTSHTDMKSVGGRSVREWPNLDSNGNNGLRMEGLSPGVNDEAMGSGVVMHGAWYNDVSSVMGRSYGCPAFESDVAPDVLRTLRGGSLYYSYTPRCRELHSRVERQVNGWQGMCE